MNNHIRRVSATGVFGRLDFDLEFDPTINIIHAANGAGKTTLLHILANVMNGDFLRFAFINFLNIKVALSTGSVISITQSGRGKEKALRVEYDQRTIINDVPIIEIQRSNRKSRRSPSSPRQLSLFENMELESDIIDWDGHEILSGSYFPAFRTMIEAWANALGEEGSPTYRRERARELALMEEYEYERRRIGAYREQGRYQILSTLEARRAFGEFVPTISYPSPTEIAESLNGQILKASLDIANKDRELLSQVFTDVFTALSQSQSEAMENSQSILNEIQDMLSDDEKASSSQRASFMRGIRSNAFDSLRSAVTSITLDADKDKDVQKLAAPILDVYRSSLRERVRTQKEAFQPIELYLNSVNEFLNDKEIIIYNSRATAEPSIAIRFRNNAIERGLRALSSGERQIITLIYAATQMSKQEVVLIDEPEISLHIDWQRILLAKMLEQIGGRQIIVCTHSPSIGANYLNNMIELKARYTSSTSDADEIDVDEYYDDLSPF